LPAAPPAGPSSKRAGKRAAGRGTSAGARGGRSASAAGCAGQSEGSIEDRKRAAAKKHGSSDKLEKAAAPAEAKTLADTAIVSGAVREAPAPTTAPAAPARAQAPAAPAAARNLAMFRVTAPGIVVVSPDAASRWRIMDDRTVQRSTDGGSTWENQQTGANVPSRQAASPSSLVCWLVGPGGTIRLSTDGRSWQPVPFPESTRLTGVTATDDKNRNGDDRRRQAIHQHRPRNDLGSDSLIQLRLLGFRSNARNPRGSVLRTEQQKEPFSHAYTSMGRGVCWWRAPLVFRTIPLRGRPRLPRATEDKTGRRSTTRSTWA